MSPKRPGAIFDLLIEGSSIECLLHESGGHRFQRVPPTERRGRVHTSTVTVAVFEVQPEVSWTLQSVDIREMFTKDTGPGGQHRNKTETCVVLRHLPTGIEAKASAKSQFQNRRTARAMLEARVAEHYRQQNDRAHAVDRKAKVGSGMRGDKIRTYREQDDRVIDHRSDIKAPLRKVLAGHLELLA